MFSLITAFLFPTAIGSKWIEEDISSQVLFNLYNNNRDIVIVLKPNFQDDYIYVSLNQFRKTYSGYNNTVTIFIASLTSSSAFSTLDAAPNKNVKYCKYANAVYAGYQISPAKAGYEIPENAPDELKPDLLLTRKNYTSSNQKLHTSCILSVNGYYHMSASDGENSYILEGANSIKHANYNAVGITSFENVAEIEKISITEDMLSIPEGFSSYYERTAFEIPDGRTFKSFFLVLGGYIVFPKEELLWKVNDNTILLNPSALPLLDRFYESNNYINLDSLGLSFQETNSSMINLDEFFSNVVMKKYYTLSQSFIVLVDADHFFYSDVNIRQAAVPGVFSHREEPKYPIFLGTGRIAEYWKKNESGRWGIYFQDGYRRNRMYYHCDYYRLETVTDQLSFINPFYLSNGKMIEIGVYQDQE